MAWIPMAVMAAGSILQGVNSKNAQKANTAQQGNIDNQLISLFNAMTGRSNDIWSGLNPLGALNQAKKFYGSEVAGGLDPAVRTDATAGFEREGARGLSAIEGALGPSSPNPGGMAKNWQEGMLTGGVALQQQLAALNQQTRQQGAAGLAGIGEAGMSASNSLLEAPVLGLMGLGQQFGAGAAANAQNAQQNNPFGALGQFLASLGLGGGGTGGVGSNSLGMGAQGTQVLPPGNNPGPGYPNQGYG
jgi:hypothetical protein